MFVESAVAEAVHTPSGEGKVIYVLGNEITVKIPSRVTGGAYTVFEGRTLPQHGPPLHRHRDQDEFWYILEGKFLFEVDGQKIEAGPGDTVLAPRGSAHTFQNTGTTAGRMVATMIPGGIDYFFEELETAAPRGAAPDFSKMPAIFEKYGQEMLGPPLSARAAMSASGAD